MRWFWKRRDPPTHKVLTPKSPEAKKIINVLTNTIPQATKIAELIGKGWIVIHLMNRAGFLAERKEQYPGCFLRRWGTMAWACGNHIFVPDNKHLHRLVVHEGGHAILSIEGRSDWYYKKWGWLKVGRAKEEDEVRRVEREFLKATRKRWLWLKWFCDKMDVLLGYYI